VQELREYSTCLLCGSSGASVLASREQLGSERVYLNDLWRKLFHPGTRDYVLKDHVYFTHTYDAQLVVCKNCGIVTRNPRLSPESALQEYTDDEYHPEWLDASFPPYCDSFLQEMPRLIKIVGSRARVLEIGSQIGGFLFAAKECGWDAQGLDVGHCMSDFARTKGFDVFTGTVSDAHFPDNCFDAVFVWSCFEMLPDPWADLQEINRILAKGGWLFISVPNGDFIKLIQPFAQAGKWNPFRERMWKFLAYGILLGFSFQLGYTPFSLRYILGKSGFNNIQVRNQLYIPITSPEHVYPWVIREKRRYLKFAHHVSEAIYHLSLHTFIKGAWIEASCQKQ